MRERERKRESMRGALVAQLVGIPSNLAKYRGSIPLLGSFSSSKITHEPVALEAFWNGYLDNLDLTRRGSTRTDSALSGTFSTAEVTLAKSEIPRSSTCPRRRSEPVEDLIRSSGPLNKYNLNE